MRIQIHRQKTDRHSAMFRTREKKKDIRGYRDGINSRSMSPINRFDSIQLLCSCKEMVKKSFNASLFFIPLYLKHKAQARKNIGK